MSTQEENNGLGVIVIAAGNSSRLGQSKQLVSFGESCLLEHAIDLANWVSDKVICVLGYDANNIEQQLMNDKNTFVCNENWREGMGSSIALGVQLLSEKVNAVMILLCDQYLLNQEDLENLMGHWHNIDRLIVASQYCDKSKNELIVGAPAIFPKAYFPQLMALKEKGAREILDNNLQYVVPVLTDNAAIDLDTKKDLKYLQSILEKQFEFNLPTSR